MSSSKPIAKTKKKTNAWDWSPVDPHEVLVVTKEGKVLLGGALITQTELKSLQQEIRALKSFHIWRVMQETVRQRAIEMGFVNAETWERAMSGKMMLHNLGILKSVIQVIEETPSLHTPLVPPRPLKHGADTSFIK